MKLSDFDFTLPEDLIATRPVFPRGNAKLLLSEGGQISDHRVSDILSIFKAGDVLVLNDTKVIPARLDGMRPRETAQGPMQAKIGVTLLDPQTDGQWSAMIKPLKKVNIGEKIVFSDGFFAELTEKKDGQAILKFNLDGDAFDAALAAVGQMPLPPYIAAKRAADAQDFSDYQTVWAREQGAVAAPTASLHIDRDALDLLEENGVEIAYVTLHVGAGTFLPVKVDDISDHKMHAEWGRVDQAAADIMNKALGEGRRVIPVGTTSLRLIESAAQAQDQIAPWQGKTDIFIKPGFQFKVAKGLMTNFHLPKSTLLMLVSAMVGVEHVKAIYDHAISKKYRFFSYGDSSILLP
ncbi:MAG: tRNA preQ1(34) S-adenosylmethionine ribosyltransferase-isomerase QueA [Halocynthiibacter sp.]